MSLCESLEHPESSLAYKISSFNKELNNKNFCNLKSIVKAIIFCGKQNIPLYGHRDDNTVNKGNFLALLHLMAETNTVLKNNLEKGKQNANCTSKTTQNEIISIIDDFIRGHRTKQLSTRFFSIIGDEITGKYDNKEILSVCVPFIERENMSEVSVELTRTTGSHITKTIMLSLARHKIGILKCRRQAYNGAAAMSSERVGVQARIKLYAH